MLEKYKNIVNDYFKEDGSFVSKDVYGSALSNKVNDVKKWEKLIGHIKMTGSVVYNRDITASSIPQTNKLIIGLGGIEQGVILNISYFPKQTGFYFCNYKNAAKIPIVDSEKSKINYLSYYPFNYKQERFAQQLVKVLSDSYLEFEFFNNLFATEKAYDVIVDQKKCHEIDFFQLFFDHNMAGIY